MRIVQVIVLAACMIMAGVIGYQIPDMLPDSNGAIILVAAMLNGVAWGAIALFINNRLD